MSQRDCVINAPEPSKFAVDPAAENENVTPYAIYAPCLMLYDYIG